MCSSSGENRKYRDNNFYVNDISRQRKKNKTNISLNYISIFKYAITVFFIRKFFMKITRKILTPNS